MDRKKLLLIFVIVLLLWGIISWGDYLASTAFAKIEPFSYEYKQNSPKYSHTVDLPINTTYSCKNVCGSKATCLITKEQCTSDVDCQGCQVHMVDRGRGHWAMQRGENDAGKLSFNQTPQYSSLTTDIGTQAKLLNPMARVPQSDDPGDDMWTRSANVGQAMFNEKSKHWTYPPPDTAFAPRYRIGESATGLFEDSGPLAANAYLA